MGGELWWLSKLAIYKGSKKQGMQLSFISVAFKTSSCQCHVISWRCVAQISAYIVPVKYSETSPISPSVSLSEHLSGAASSYPFVSKPLVVWTNQCPTGSHVLGVMTARSNCLFRNNNGDSLTFHPITVSTINIFGKWQFPMTTSQPVLCSKSSAASAG